jgi:hypothetical protein
MTNTMSFTLDEIPLVIHDGVAAGFVNGEAEIEYTSDGEWMIVDIYLDGASTMVNGKRTWPRISAPPVIAAIIDTRLNKEWYAHVCDAVREQIESDREDAAEARADYRRDARMGL